MTIRTIETRYAGYRFRSRTEARWAVFLESLGLPWLYEPEGYELPSGWYLPDFLIYPATDHAMWLEIKARRPDPLEMAKCADLALLTKTPTYLYFDRSFQAPPAQPNVTYDDFFSDVEWFEAGSGRWECRETKPGWMTRLPMTAVMCNESLRHRTLGPGDASWWWMDCPYCGRIRIKLHGQIGFCPELTPEQQDVLDPPYPSFAHRTPRLLAAFDAARSARFEHGESGAQ